MTDSVEMYDAGAQCGEAEQKLRLHYIMTNELEFTLEDFLHGKMHA